MLKITVNGKAFFDVVQGEDRELTIAVTDPDNNDQPFDLTDYELTAKFTSIEGTPVEVTDFTIDTPATGTALMKISEDESLLFKPGQRIDWSLQMEKPGPGGDRYVNVYRGVSVSPQSV